MKKNPLSETSMATLDYRIACTTRSKRANKQGFQSARAGRDDNEIPEQARSWTCTCAHKCAIYGCVCVRFSSSSRVPQTTREAKRAGNTGRGCSQEKRGQSKDSCHCQWVIRSVGHWDATTFNFSPSWEQQQRRHRYINGTRNSYVYYTPKHRQRYLSRDACTSSRVIPFIRLLYSLFNPTDSVPMRQGKLNQRGGSVDTRHSRHASFYRRAVAAVLTTTREC